MKFIKPLLVGLVLGIVAGLFLYNRFIEDPDNVIEVRYDSIIYRFDTIPIPQPYEVVKYVDRVRIDTFIRPDTIKLYDTITIVQDYKDKRFYSDTIRNDELVAYLDETVQFNRITNRDFSYQILRPMYIKQDNSIGVGLSYYGTFIPNVYYNRKNWSVSVGYNKELYLGVQYKLIQF